LKLPYNVGANPYDAARKFIEGNKLPMTYIDQVANFITTNTQGATLGVTQEQPSAPGSDPWGSDQRYRPDGVAPQTPQVPKILPQKDYLSILVARVPAIQKKIQELNRELLSDGHKDISLNPTELTILASLCKHLESSGATTTSQTVSGGLELAIKLATVWPYADRLPGLDLLRLLAVAPKTATLKLPSGANIIHILSTVTENEPPAENHIMMAIRSFSNLFATPEGRVLSATEFSKIQNIITPYLESTNRNLLVATTTVYINYAVFFNSSATAGSFDTATAILEKLGTILEKQKDSEVVYRALVALGTLLGLNDEVRQAAKEVFTLGPIVEKASAKATDPRVKNVAKEIAVLLQ
jgi:phospholipase A-2-activating protein